MTTTFAKATVHPMFAPAGTQAPPILSASSSLERRFRKSGGHRSRWDGPRNHDGVGRTHDDPSLDPMSPGSLAVTCNWKSETDTNALVQGMSQVETRSERTMGRDGGRKRRRGEPGWPPPKRVDSDPLCAPESHQVHHGISTTHRSRKTGG